MRFIDDAQLENICGKMGLGVSRKEEWYRVALVFNLRDTLLQRRIGCEKPDAAFRLFDFAQALIRWHEQAEGRLLWIDHWEGSGCPGPDALFAAVRKGLNAPGDDKVAPGHYFDPQPWHEDDQTLLSPENTAEINLLTGLIVLVCLSYSDGWLIADGSTDRIEFWEDHVLFHSTDGSRLKAAKVLMHEYNCTQTFFK